MTVVNNVFKLGFEHDLVNVERCKIYVSLCVFTYFVLQAKEIVYYR